MSTLVPVHAHVRGLHAAGAMEAEASAFASSAAPGDAALARH
jgi:hypothetical protein